MKKISLYLDTSVIGGYFDFEFEQPTKKLFDLIRIGVYHSYISTHTVGELTEAPPFLYKRFDELVNELECIEIEENEESIELSELYIQNKVVSTKFLDDARHVAIATIHKIDYIISWNFKHLVNVNRIRGFNAVNIKNGYSMIDIRTPLEVIGDEPK